MAAWKVLVTDGLEESGKALMREIAEFCREYWSEIANDRDSDTLDDEDIARIYFELHPDESLQTDRVAIDAPPAALVTGEQP